MSTWAEIKTAARQAVHETFKRAAVFTPVSTGIPVDVFARLHPNVKKFGDLDREGYAEVYEDVTRVVFDAAEVPSPARGDAVMFIETGETYLIDFVLPMDREVEVVCEVTRA